MDLVADIGGTKTVLAKTSGKPGEIKLSSIKRYECREYDSFELILVAYLTNFPNEVIESLMIAIAGPVKNNSCHMTNLSWHIDGAGLSQRFGIGQVNVQNDLVMSGYGIDEIAEKSIAVIQPGKADARGNRVLISPGTGLGETIIHYVNGRYIPIASEGGHADFASIDGISRRLWDFIKKANARVSVEDILSGPGLYQIYRFLSYENGHDPDAQFGTKSGRNLGPSITAEALEGKNQVAVKSVGIFLDLLAAEAGNMALKSLATRGVYFGGGILPHLLPLLDKKRFCSIFADKGAHHDLLTDIPIRVITDTNLPLYGAACFYHDIT